VACLVALLVRLVRPLRPVSQFSAEKTGRPDIRPEAAGTVSTGPESATAWVTFWVEWWVTFFSGPPLALLPMALCLGCCASAPIPAPPPQPSPDPPSTAAALPQALIGGVTGTRTSLPSPTERFPAARPACWNVPLLPEPCEFDAGR